MVLLVLGYLCGAAVVGFFLYQFTDPYQHHGPHWNAKDWFWFLAPTILWPFLLMFLASAIAWNWIKDLFSERK